MAECFEYKYSARRQEEVEAIRKKYLPKEEDKMETLRALDRKAEKPGLIVAITIGLTGVLVLGIGMCCTMLWADKFFLTGIAVGVLGMLITGTAYPIYKRITEKQRAKFAEQILALTSELAI